MCSDLHVSHVGHSAIFTDKTMKVGNRVSFFVPQFRGLNYYVVGFFFSFFNYLWQFKVIQIMWNSFLCHTLLFDIGEREDKSVFAVFSFIICLSSVICFNFALNYYEVVGVDLLCMQTRHHC